MRVAILGLCILVLSGCATAVMTESITIKNKDGSEQKIERKIRRETHFADSSVEGLNVKCGGTSMTLNKYEKKMNPESIKEAGTAMEKNVVAAGKAGGEVVNTVLEAHGVPSIK